MTLSHSGSPPSFRVMRVTIVIMAAPFEWP
jgi:hypothetical protein